MKYEEIKEEIEDGLVGKVTCPVEIDRKEAYLSGFYSIKELGLIIEAVKTFKTRFRGDYKRVKRKVR